MVCDIHLQVLDIINETLGSVENSRCHYFQFHFDSQWLYVWEFRLSVKIEGESGSSIIAKFSSVK